ncbi:MAG TPA: cytochrome c oxidase subunit II [Acetobacteraceae bacterium]|nr:cytochrome c oxidase subunit II [Acetobacteraceae bacterium]
MQDFRRFKAALATLLLVPVLMPGGAAHAQAPTPWEMAMQPAFSPVKQQIIDLHDMVLVIITVITLFVGGLLGWVMYRYNATRNPVPGHATHNTVLEVAWTVIPVLILVVIAIPSFRLVYYENRTADPDLTIKVTGHQWYWEYTYPDRGNIDFTSYIVPGNQLKPGQLRLLTADHPLVVPVNKNIRILETSGDVIHSFFIPSLGVQRYAIPGRTIETWMRVDKPGTYYGECNQICGTNHSRMPIMVKAVTEPQFEAWLVEAKKQFSSAAPQPAPGYMARDDHPTPDEGPDGTLLTAANEVQH